MDSGDYMGSQGGWKEGWRKRTEYEKGVDSSRDVPYDLS
jgi:hypothetical protein